MGPTIHTPVAHFGDIQVPIFHETHPVEAPQFPPVPLSHPHHDFSTTPVPNFRKPYPTQVKQLTHTPGNTIPLKHHGPFKVQALHVRGPPLPTTTLPPAFISTLPPRIGVTPPPSQTVISTTFSNNRFEPNYQYHPNHHQIVSTQRPSGHPTIYGNQRPLHIHVGVVVTPTTAAPSYGFQHHFVQERKSNTIVSQLSDERFLKTTLAPFLTESRSQLQPPVSDYLERKNERKDQGFIDKIRNKVENSFGSNLPGRENLESIRPGVEPVTRAGFFRPQLRRAISAEKRDQAPAFSSSQDQAYLNGDSEIRNFRPSGEDVDLILQAENHNFSKIG